MKELCLFMSYQTKAEVFLSAFFLTLLVYMIIVFWIKQKHKKTISIFMLKRKNLLCGITYLVTVGYMAAGCLVLKILDNVLVYLGVMILAALAVNYLFILGYGVKKLKDLEFSDVTDTYSEITDYCELADRITGYISDFVSFLSCIDEDEIGGYSFELFNNTWSDMIQDYLKERINKLEYIRQNKDKKVLFNYIRNLCIDMWYEDEQIKAFVEELCLGNEVILDASKRLIPITSKRFSCIIYIEANETTKQILDIDRNFIVNTYNIFSLL